MRSIYVLLGLFSVLVAGGAAVGGETKAVPVASQPACASATCMPVPTSYAVREVFYVPTTVETTYEVTSQKIVQGEPVRAEVCKPRARLRLPRLRLFGNCCQ